MSAAHPLPAVDARPLDQGVPGEIVTATIQARLARNVDCGACGGEGEAGGEACAPCAGSGGFCKACTLPWPSCRCDRLG